MCDGLNCEFYFVDEFANEEFCLNEEKCNKIQKKRKFINLDGESDYDGK